MKQAEEWILIDFINKNGHINSQQFYFTTQLVVFFHQQIRGFLYQADKMRRAWRGSDLMGRAWSNLRFYIASKAPGIPRETLMLGAVVVTDLL